MFSLIRIFDTIVSKILSLDITNKKMPFYLVMFSLIRIFANGLDKV